MSGFQAEILCYRRTPSRLIEQKSKLPHEQFLFALEQGKDLRYTATKMASIGLVSGQGISSAALLFLVVACGRM